MKRIKLFIIIIVLLTVVSIAYAKYESGSNDAISILGYGYNSSLIVPLQVDATGVLQVQ